MANFPVNEMTVADQIAVGARVLLGAVLGVAIGFERWRARKFAAVRTHMIVATASALACAVTTLAVPDGTEGPRTLAAVFAGIGFIGGGAIIQTKSAARGITSASVILLAATVGATAGMGAPVLATAVTVIAICGLLALGLMYDRFPDPDPEAE